MPSGGKPGRPLGEITARGPLSVAEAVRRATLDLAQAGVSSPDLDAELLLRHVLRWDRARFLAGAHARLTEDQTQAFQRSIFERARRRPLQHLTGVQAFWRHEFVVSADVLIPRPETELLVETALEVIAGRTAPTVVDVGTGSGCIALSIAAERPDAAVVATDLAPAALVVAVENARRLGLAKRVVFVAGDLLAPLAANGLAAESVDLIVSNPPYVAASDPLEPEVRDHEPALALFAPGEPLALYRRLAPEALAYLRPSAALAVEVGAGQAGAVTGILSGCGYAVDGTRRDLRGIERVVLARRP